MSRSAFRTMVLSSWFIALLLFVGVQVAGGSQISILALAVVSLLATIPPALMILVLRDPPVTDPAIYRDRRLAVAARLRSIEHRADPDAGQQSLRP